MKVELLVFEGCPNWEPAKELLRASMASLEITGTIQEIRVESLDQARALAFPGSPTLRVNGQDMAPLPEGFEPAMGCRTYLVQGRRQGLPDAALVLEALRKARAQEATAACPACGIKGKPVKPVTLRSLLQPHLLPLVREQEYRFCASQDCALVYYSADGAQTFVRTDLTVRVGLKERSAPRPLCYCFGHSAESIQEEWGRTGKTTVVDAIKAELKAGGCHCEVTNPSGGCCLGDVITEVKALTSKATAPAPGHDCCAPSDPSCC